MGTRAASASDDPGSPAAPYRKPLARATQRPADRASQAAALASRELTEVPAPASPSTDLVRRPPGVDGWIVPPHTPTRRKRGRGSEGRTGAVIAQRLVELVEQFCIYQRKQRGRTEGGVKTYRWNLEQFLVFVRARSGRLARSRTWSARRSRRGSTTWRHRTWSRTPCGSACPRSRASAPGSSSASSCPQTPRPDRTAGPPGFRPGGAGAQPHGCPHRGGEATGATARSGDLPDPALHRDAARLRREPAASAMSIPSGASAAVRVKGGKTQDIPLPATVIQFLAAYVERLLAPECERAHPGHAPLLVELGPTIGGPRPEADGRQEHLAALQDLRKAHRLSGAQAA